MKVVVQDHFSPLFIILTFVVLTKIENSTQLYVRTLISGSLGLLPPPCNVSSCLVIPPSLRTYVLREKVNVVEYAFRFVEIKR